MTGRGLLGAGLCAMWAACCAADENPVASTPSPRDVHTLATAVAASTAGALLAVGERGHILVSHDHGDHWRSVPTPVDVLLTGVCFADERTAYAVGHDETMLMSVDGGERWRVVHHNPNRRQPLLDVACLPDRTAVAVGAYSTVIRATDGGQRVDVAELTAAPVARAKRPTRMDDDAELEQPHLNAIAVGPDGVLVVAAEGGHLYRSQDAGKHWSSLPSPYAGSLFTVLALSGHELLVGGLRGHLFRSDDAGQHWVSVDSAKDVLLDGATQLPDGRVVVVGLAGVVLVSTDGGRHVHSLRMADRKGIAAVVATPEGAVIAGETGVHRLQLPAPR